MTARNLQKEMGIIQIVSVIPTPKLVTKCAKNKDQLVHCADATCLKKVFSRMLHSCTL